MEQAYEELAAGDVAIAASAQRTPCTVERMASDFSMRAMNVIHRGLLRISRGKIGWQAMGMPMLELTTVGRKSGEARATMLSSPLQIGESVIVVASRGGDDKHPAWYLNLVNNPRVEVVIRGKTREVRNARVATSSERERLWPIIATKHSNYAGYQKKTEREIPLVFLEPVAAAHSPGAAAA